MQPCQSSVGSAGLERDAGAQSPMANVNSLTRFSCYLRDALLLGYHSEEHSEKEVREANVSFQTEACVHL